MWPFPCGHLTGIVDDARIYDRALLEAEILFIMEGGEGYPYALGPKPADGSEINKPSVGKGGRIYLALPCEKFLRYFL
jgi:hypothetical protein